MHDLTAYGDCRRAAQMLLLKVVNMLDDMLSSCIYSSATVLYCAGFGHRCCSLSSSSQLAQLVGASNISVQRERSLCCAGPSLSGKDPAGGMLPLCFCLC